MQQFHRHEKAHHRYTLFSVGAEYTMAFSLHLLPSLNLSTLSKVLGLGTFAVYTVVSILYFRKTIV